METSNSKIEKKKFWKLEWIIHRNSIHFGAKNRIKLCKRTLPAPPGSHHSRPIVGEKMSNLQTECTYKKAFSTTKRYESYAPVRRQLSVGGHHSHVRIRTF